MTTPVTLETIAENVAQNTQRMERLTENVAQNTQSLTQTNERVEAMAHSLAQTNERVEAMAYSLTQTNERVEAIAHDLSELRVEVTKFNDRMETYQRANDRLVNLALSIITGGTVALIVGMILLIVREV